MTFTLLEPADAGRGHVGRGAGDIWPSMPISHYHKVLALKGTNREEGTKCFTRNVLEDKFPGLVCFVLRTTCQTGLMHTEYQNLIASN